MSLAAVVLGAERARIEVRPAGVDYSLGEPAAELAERCGFALEPWQRDGLDLMLSVRDDGRWACFEYAEICARQNGKTGLFVVRALAGLLLLDEKLVMWSAHEYKTAIEAYRLVKDLLMRIGKPVVENRRDNLIDVGKIRIKILSTNGEEGFERLDTGARLRFVARSKGSGRGFTADTHLIDEAFAYTPAQHSALMPTLNAVPNPQICYASSPPLDSESGEVLFALRERVASGKETQLGYRDWGLPGDLDELERMPKLERDAFLDDRQTWAATNPALGRGRLTGEAIERNRRSMGELDFAREILGVWPVPPGLGGRVIRRGVWDALAVPRDSQITSQCVFAVDGTPEQTFGAIVVGGRTEGGRAQLENVPWSRAGGPRPVGLDWIVPRAVELDAEHEPACWLVDPSGPVGHLADALEAAGLPVERVTGRAWSQACGAFFDAVNAAEPVIAHLADPELDEAVGAGRKRVELHDGSWAWGRRTSEANIAPLCAATLGYHGVVNFVSDMADNVW